MGRAVVSEGDGRMSGTIPHLRIVIAFCVAAIIGYAVFSVWAVFIARDATMIGDVVGTWKSFAVAAFAFWLGSSSGGKAKADAPAGTKDDPLAVEGARDGHKAVETTQGNG
jgi:hypothetical protein